MGVLHINKSLCLELAHGQQPPCFIIDLSHTTVSVQTSQHGIPVSNSVLGLVTFSWCGSALSLCIVIGVFLLLRTNHTRAFSSVQSPLSIAMLVLVPSI
jgi:hypothetical protein